MTTFSTPGGRCSFAIRAIASTASGASADGSKTIVLPAASAGAILGSQGHGSVPRHDRRNDAPRLSPGVAQDVLAQWRRLALQLTRQASEVAEQFDRQGDLRTSLRADCTAGLGCQQPSEILSRSLQAVSDGEEHPAALPETDRSPGFERILCGPDGRIDVDSVPTGHFAGHGPAFRRVLDRWSRRSRPRDPDPRPACRYVSCRPIGRTRRASWIGMLSHRNRPVASSLRDRFLDSRGGRACTPETPPLITQERATRG